ncbi:hypothetical protein [Streptomyces lydicus]|uniref:hypothetical protein n=1 Tax=Streptomyces lydicus TaxID=47763 RepID=UPI0037D263AA
MRNKLAGLIGIIALTVAFGSGVVVHNLEADGAGKGVHVLATNEGPGASHQ